MFWFAGPVPLNVQPKDNSKAAGESVRSAVSSGDASKLSQPLKVIYDSVVNYEKTKDSKDLEFYLEYGTYLENSSILEQMAFYGEPPTMGKKGGNLQSLEEQTFLKIRHRLVALTIL